MPLGYDFFVLFTICRARVPYPFQCSDFNARDTFAIMASDFVAIIKVKLWDFILI